MTMEERNLEAEVANNLSEYAAPMTKRIALSKHNAAVENGQETVLFAVTTLEDEQLLVLMSTTTGYRILKDAKESDAAWTGPSEADIGSKSYDDLNALLMDVSPGYQAAFGASVAAKLQGLAGEG